MTKKLRISAVLLATSLSGAFLPAYAGPENQDDLFWANVQLTEGVQPDQVHPMPTAAQLGEAQAQDWFALERQKSDGYTGDNAVKPATGFAQKIASAFNRVLSR